MVILIRSYRLFTAVPFAEIGFILKANSTSQIQHRCEWYSWFPVIRIWCLNCCDGCSVYRWITSVCWVESELYIFLWGWCSNADLISGHGCLTLITKSMRLLWFDFWALKNNELKTSRIFWISDANRISYLTRCTLYSRVMSLCKIDLDQQMIR